MWGWYCSTNCIEGSKGMFSTIFEGMFSTIFGDTLFFLDDDDEGDKEEEEDEEEEEEEKEEESKDAAINPLIVLSRFLEEAATPSIRVTEENNDLDRETIGLGISLDPTSSFPNAEFKLFSEVWR